MDGAARKILFLFAGVLAGCAREPAWQALPAQYHMPAGAEPEAEPLGFARLLVHMSDADVERHIVSGVMAADAGAPSRWSTERARLRLEIDDPRGLRAYLHFFIPGDTFKTTGPQSVMVFINDAPLGAVRYTAPGDHEFRREVPEGMINPGPLELSFAVSPPFQSKTDQTRYGVVLFSAGFERP